MVASLVCVPPTRVSYGSQRMHIYLKNGVVLGALTWACETHYSYSAPLHLQVYVVWEQASR